MKDFRYLAELPGTPQEQEWLRDRLETMSVKEGIILTAAVEEKPPSTAADAVNDCLGLSDHFIWAGAGDYKQLGEYYANNVALLPEAVQEYTDFEKLGQMYAENHPGRFSEGHYVEFHTGEPYFHYDPETEVFPANTDWSVKIKLTSQAEPEGVWLRLPDFADGEVNEIALALDALKVQTVQECTIQDTRCVLSGVGNLMEQYTDAADLIYDGNELWLFLDNQYQGFPNYMEHLSAAMEYENCHDLRSALNIAQNIQCYEWIPRDKLIETAEKELRDLGVSEKIIQSGAIDLKAYGDDVLVNQGYRLTADESAYIARNSREFVCKYTTPPAPEMQI